MSDVRHEGVVTRVFRNRGFGFVKQDGGGNVFLHHSDCPDGLLPDAGAVLNFALQKSVARGVRAVAIKVVR